MQISLSNSLKKIALSIMIMIGLTQALSARSCESRAFNIKVTAKVSSYDILNQLSSECGFSMLSLDSVANSKLNEKLFGINIHQMRLNDIFKLLISSKGLQYKYDKNVLKISGLITRTFKIDYVNSERSGSSNTDISMNGDTGSDANSVSSGSTTEGTSSDTSSSGAGSQTTGATITSSDSFKFWSTIQKELTAIVNSPLDKFKAPAPIINKEAGLVTVSGTASQIRRISSYLDDMMRRLHKQVTIDVKIYSVRLDNSKATGIDWSEIYKFQKISANFESLRSNGVSKIEDNHITEWGDSVPSGYGKFVRLTGNVSINNLINFLNTQGDVSSVSNPKVTTLNNQPAIFSSGEQLYYKIIQSVSNVSAGGSATGNNEIVRSVFAGVLLDITPEITDENEIILKINPSISSVKSTTVTTGSSVRNIPPDMKKQQMSAVVKLKDGEKIVLGGLITSSKGTETKKVPILGNLPVLGTAFSRKVDTDKKEELVIIITPHIVSPYKKVSLKTLGYDGVK